MKRERLHGLDIFRGTAIVFMVIYHFTYDLMLFDLIQLKMNHDPTLLAIRYTIMSMFLLSVGISLALVHQQHIVWHKIRHRSFKIGLAALAVSIATYIIFPNSWIYFGMLHFILVGSILVLPLLKLPKTTLLLAITIFIASQADILHMHYLYSLLQEPLGLPYPRSQDLVRLFPWLSIILIGMLIVQYNWHQKIFHPKFFNMHYPLNKLLKKVGQNSLVIYLLHQPILFLGFELYIKIF